MKYLPYAVFGTENTPADVLEVMAILGAELEQKGWIQRNGGDTGAEEAFLSEIQDTNKVELFLPWQGYNGYQSDMPSASQNSGGMEMAFLHHPNWESCNESVRKIHARKSFIALGQDIRTPALFAVGWTPNAEIAGEAAQLLRLCLAKSIPVFNLANGEDELNELVKFVEIKEQ